MANAYVGNPYALVFPVDCDGFLKIPYSRNAGVGTFTANTSSNTTLSNVSAFTGLDVGMPITGTGIPDNTTIRSLDTSANTMTISNAATATATGVTISFGSHTDITETDLWSHGAGFTVEAVITPYDVNGNGQTGKGKVQENTGISVGTFTATTSSNTTLSSISSFTGLGIGMPITGTGIPNNTTIIDIGTTTITISNAATASASGVTISFGDYANGITDRYAQKMMLFSNTSFQFYLENQTTGNVNQPAEYRLAAKVGSTTLNSPTVIKPVNTLHGYYDAKGFYNGMRTSLTEISTNASHSPPSRVITIDNNNFTNETNVAFVASTGDVTFSGAPESYYPAQQATASITFDDNTFAVDATPVAATGHIEFTSGLNPVSTPSGNYYIQVVSENGSTTTRWFPVDGQTHSNNVDLHSFDGDVWSSGDRGFVTTSGGGVAFNKNQVAKQFRDAVNGNGWSGSVTQGAVGTVNEDTVYFTAAITGTSPTRVGTGGSLTLGSGFAGSGNPELTAMSGGVDEVVHTEFITINTGSGDKKYRIFNSGAVGSIQTSSSVSYITFRKGASLSDTMSSLVSAINDPNGNTEVTASALSNNGVTLTVDAAGTAGNSLATPTTTNMSFVDAISAFSGGEAANETDKHIQLVDADGTTVKFLAAHQTKSTNSTGSTITLSGVQYVIYRLPTSGSNRANFAQAVNGASNLDITAANDGSNGNKVNLTQDATGTSGNTTITLANSISNVTANSFTGGAGSNPNVAIDITNASGNTVRYKPSVNENTGASDGTYTFFQKGGSTTATATNLASAINSTQGTTISAAPSSNTVTISMLTAGSSYAATENSSSVSLDGAFTALANKITVDVNQTGLLGVGNKIYDSNGVLVSTVSAINGTVITLDETITSVTSTIYKEQPKEALYVNNLYKVSCVLEKSGKLKLFFNNTLVAETAISSFTFDMANADCFIGQDGTNVSTQFMGELYEIAMKKGAQPSPSLHTLDPGYSDIIFYYRFGDE